MYSTKDMKFSELCSRCLRDFFRLRNNFKPSSDQQQVIISLFNFCNRWLQVIIQFRGIRAFKRSRRNRMDELQNRPIYPCTILVIPSLWTEKDLKKFESSSPRTLHFPAWNFLERKRIRKDKWCVKYEISQEMVIVNSERQWLLIFFF